MESDGRKNNGGHSTKGRAGRKPKDQEQRIRDLVSPYIPDAIQTVVKILQTAERDSDRLSAARLLIEYGYGKPQQNVDVKSDGQHLFMNFKKSDD